MSIFEHFYKLFSLSILTGFVIYIFLIYLPIISQTKFSQLVKLISSFLMFFKFIWVFLSTLSRNSCVDRDKTFAYQKNFSLVQIVPLGPKRYKQKMPRPVR